jgi:hypothetical protein
MQLAQLLNFIDGAFDSLFRVDHQQPFSREIAEHRVPEDVEVVRIGGVDAELRRDGQQHVGLPARVQINIFVFPMALDQNGLPKLNHVHC